MKKEIRISLLRTIVVVAVLAGAIGPPGLTLYMAQQQIFSPDYTFLIWAISPFIGLLFTDVVSKRWPDVIQTTLYILMIIMPLSSLVVYSGVLGPKGLKPAGVFLIVPLIWWVLIVIVLLLATFVSPGELHRRDGQ